MVNSLFLEDSYRKKCDARVSQVTESKYVILDQTIFYPKGGGQPHDLGHLIKDHDRYTIEYVGSFSGKISHEVDREGLKPGDKVYCLLDWERRYKLMRSHTAAHTFASLLCNGTGALITGNQLGVEKTRFDFNLKDFDRSILKQYVDEANQLFQKDIPVKIYHLPKEKAFKIPGIIKMAKALPPDIPTLRIVEIIGIDTQADGGTHVKNLLEVGQIRVMKTVNKGKNNRRIYFSLDPLSVA